MDARKSDLSSPGYGYDMVVATTQDSINTTLKQFLHAYDAKEITVCYKYNDKGDVSETDFDALVIQAGADPFAIASGTYHKTDPVARLGDAGFAFAFRAQMGLPHMDDPTKIPDIIIFNKGNSVVLNGRNSPVTYQLFCKKFSILNLAKSAAGDISWTNLSQPANAPWIISMDISMNLRTDNATDAFSKLPAAVQSSIKNLNPDSAFSVQQLYLDLNTVRPNSPPVITGLDKNADAYIYLTKIFINKYISGLSTGKVILGYSVQPQVYNPNPDVPSIIPTDLVVEVSPERNASGQETGNYKLYTLNYLIMTKKNKMPAPAPFTWNWVEDNQKLDYDGAMSIKRATFVDYLNDKLSPWLSSICLDPHARVWYDGGNTLYSATVSKNGQSQRYSAGEGSNVLQFKFHSESYNEAGWRAAWGSLQLTYDLVSLITCADRQIKIDTKATFYLDFAFMHSHSMGYPMKYESNLIYNCDIDASGNIVITPVTPADIKDLSDKSDSSTWSSFANWLTGGEVREIISNISSNLHSNALLIDNFDTYVKNTLQNNNFWLFPGGKTFLFKEIFFSDNQDLVTHITYADPS